jgi:glycosyltransferase involved in cell wall biosynthesis
MRINLLSQEQLAKEPASGDWTERVRLLTVGRIESEKNPALVIEALAQLERLHPGRYSLTWVGTGHLEGELRARAARLGIEERLELPGFIPFGPELLERYRAADALLHVSLTEGLPQVLYEAMGSGLPIVATDVGGVREALADGDAGLIVPPRDLQALVDAVLELTSDPQLRSRLAARALELSEEVVIESQSARVASFILGAPESSG